jgi:cytochrome b561
MSAPNPRPDLPDALLRRLTAAAVAAIIAWFLMRGFLSEAWRTPGSPERPVAWFNAHVLCSLAGVVLIAVHSGGFLRRPPALILLALLGLVALGVIARVRVSREMARTFGSKTPHFPAPDAAALARLRELIAEKRKLLAQLDPQADEGTFSVNLPHFLRAPRLALAYRRLATEEARLLGTRAAVSRAQGAWRPLHLLLAWLFVVGIVIHVVTVTFFAGYVADGGPVTWWHVTAWGGPK